VGASQMNEDEYNTLKESCIYKPNQTETKALNATIGVKFSRDIFVSKDKCDQWKIPYKDEELEDTIIGKALRIKRDNELIAESDYNPV
jgi:hypothetical protein